MECLVTRTFVRGASSIPIESEDFDTQTELNAWSRSRWSTPRVRTNKSPAWTGSRLVTTVALVTDPFLINAERTG